MEEHHAKTTKMLLYPKKKKNKSFSSLFFFTIVIESSTIPDVKATISKLHRNTLTAISLDVENKIDNLMKI